MIVLLNSNIRNFVRDMINNPPENTSFSAPSLSVHYYEAPINPTPNNDPLGPFFHMNDDYENFEDFMQRNQSPEEREQEDQEEREQDEEDQEEDNQDEEEVYPEEEPEDPRDIRDRKILEAAIVAKSVETWYDMYSGKPVEEYSDSFEHLMIAIEQSVNVVARATSYLLQVKPIVDFSGGRPTDNLLPALRQYVDMRLEKESKSPFVDDKQVESALCKLEKLYPYSKMCEGSNVDMLITPDSQWDAWLHHKMLTCTIFLINYQIVKFKNISAMHKRETGELKSGWWLESELFQKEFPNLAVLVSSPVGICAQVRIMETLLNCLSYCLY